MTYKEVYETSDFEIKVRSKLACKYNEYCWNPATWGNCPEWNHTNFVFSPSKKAVWSNYCTSSSIGCNVMCFPKVNCITGQWEVSPIGNRFKVYKKTYMQKQVTIRVQVGETSSTLSLMNTETEDSI